MAYIEQSRMSSTLPRPVALESASEPPSIFTRRSAKQLGLFFAGASFFALSTFITRRSLLRRYKATVPKFYQPSNQPDLGVNGAIEAFEALNIATINVLSISMMVGGGALWALDITTLEDAKLRFRRSIGAEDGGLAASRADEEMEEWIATILARKDKKDALKEVVQEALKKETAQDVLIKQRVQAAFEAERQEKKQ